MDVPLFPLHTVLCPGIALPLHVFEERYRLLVDRCLERSEPFGVVLIRQGREVGPLEGRIARIGTTAVIREAGHYPDGRYDLVTVGEQRFRIEKLAAANEPYLVADVRYLDEPIGDGDTARGLSERVSGRFLRYLEALQPALADEDGPEIEIEIEVHEEAGDAADPAASLADAAAAGHGADGDRREVLMAAARRLVTPDDPTALSYVLSGLVQVELPARQRLLEAADTETRLRRLDELLNREIGYLGRNLKPLVVDANATDTRRN
ncbi:MAG: LON peptidase substrate-binding domain-containing protein [Candidatus Limnocylindrales bacterium]